MDLKNIVGNLIAYETRFKEHKKHMENDSKEDLLALKTKKGKQSLSRAQVLIIKITIVELVCLPKASRLYSKLKKAKFSMKHKNNNVSIILILTLFLFVLNAETKALS